MMIARTRHVRRVATRRPSAPSVRAAGVVGVVLSWCAGCLSVPPGATPMCSTSDDCDRAHGEVCEAGVCWGNPPPGPFAGVISPPSTRRDLAPRELTQLPITDAGWMGDLAFDAPVLLSGRIMEFCPPPMVTCDAIPLGATITVSRRSQFQGGPGFKTVVNVDSDGSFAIPVPRTGAADDPYTVTIVPDDSQLPGAGPSAAALVPPMRMQVGIASNTARTIELGGADLPVISGSLFNSVGQGLAGYRVSALGRWDPTASPTEVSSVDVTDASGTYAVTLADQLVGTVELVAHPTGPGTAPTIHLANIDATRSSQQRPVTAPTDLGAPTELDVVVTGVASGGMISAVRGAVVSVAGAESPTSTLTSFTVADEQITDDTGTVRLRVLDGSLIASSYRLSITPPANSNLGVMFEDKVTLDPGKPVTTLPKRLPARIALLGTIVDHDGNPLGNVAVTARPSLRFLWTLDAAPQAFVAAIPAATAVTPDGTGEFVLWLDPNVAQVWGNYDLTIEPPTGSLAPTYVKSEIEIVRDPTAATVSVGRIELPDPAYVHGRIAGPGGDTVEDAELKLYLVSTELNLCSEVAHAPTTCPIPAQLQGRNTSDVNGLVRLTLPR